jgi:hypothetical protein
VIVIEAQPDREDALPAGTQTLAPLRDLGYRVEGRASFSKSTRLRFRASSRSLS